MHIFIFYDISDTARRNAAAKILQGKGSRFQKSFFYCSITQTQLEQLRSQLIKIIDLENDSLHIYPIENKSFKNIISLENSKQERTFTYRIA